MLFRGHLPVTPALALLHTCANGSNDSVLLLHLPMLFHIMAGNPVPKRLVGHGKEHQKLKQKDAVLVPL